MVDREEWNLRTIYGHVKFQGFGKYASRDVNWASKKDISLKTCLGWEIDGNCNIYSM